jgi:hypothetical protein
MITRAELNAVGEFHQLPITTVQKYLLHGKNHSPISVNGGGCISNLAHSLVQQRLNLSNVPNEEYNFIMARYGAERLRHPATTPHNHFKINHLANTKRTFSQREKMYQTTTTILCYSHSYEKVYE